MIVEKLIDLLVDFDSDVGLFYLFEIQHRLEEIIGVPKIDLIQQGALHRIKGTHTIRGSQCRVDCGNIELTTEKNFY